MENGKDRFCSGGFTKESHFMLDGKRFETYEAEEYLCKQGFSRYEAIAYLDSLPREIH
jgi:hypothetical protein